MKDMNGEDLYPGDIVTLRSPSYHRQVFAEVDVPVEGKAGWLHVILPAGVEIEVRASDLRKRDEG